RRLENEDLHSIYDGQKMFNLDGIIKVGIHQFYGIEINDFAVTVAKTALWIAESQMMRETEEIIEHDLDFLPLKSYANIVEGNSLRLDWADVVPREKLSYIMGNPPFVGKSYQSKSQKEDMAQIFKQIKGYGNLDYVACWDKKATDFMNNTSIRCAFVSTNSICQGIAVPPLWDYLFNKGIYINFAYNSFIWKSEATLKAVVHCVIIGFSYINMNARLYNGKQFKTVKNINAYLMDAPNIIISSRPKPLNDVPEMFVGSCPTDGGNLILTPDEYNELIQKEPISKKYTRKYIGADEFIKGKVRYCLWLKNCSPNELKKMPTVVKRVKQVKEFRLASKKEQTRKRAETPMLFAEDRYVPTVSLLIPMVSSENRKYIPMG
ncbi:MAG: methylase, partial [Ruminococcus sp.]|nr:methylase [Ruminococcus sp.]